MIRQRLIFAGTPDFAACALAALLDAGHVVPLVLTQPDRPAGRGMKLTPSAVKRLALERGLTVAQPASLRDADSQALIAAQRADVMVVAAYGLILPRAVLDLPRRGCLNIHASLLPRWRGAAPIQRAILAGDAETGITIMQMDAGLDTGAMLLAAGEPIRADDTAATLHDRLATLGGRLIVEALARLDRLVPAPQDDRRASYAAKISKAEAALDWRRPAAELERAVRAYQPFPVAHFRHADDTVRVWAASVAAGAGQPGEILRADADGIVVACGDGALRLLALQRPGGKPQAAADFLRGQALPAGTRLT